MFNLKNYIYIYIYILIPPLEQNVRQGQLLNRVEQVLTNSFSSPRLVAIPSVKSPVFLTIYASQGRG